MYELNRRHFLSKLLQAGSALALPGLCSEAFAQTSFAGKLLIVVQMQGAWDVTSFCDPKTNQASMKEINTWARSKSIGTAGNLHYAPFAINQSFFEKHYRKMLVINGVDIQTNSHDTGEIVAWSGRTALGYPSLSAIHAATYAPDKALAYLSLGGWGNTEGIINATRVYPSALRDVIYPNEDNYNSGKTMVSPSNLDRIAALHQQTMHSKLAETSVMPQDRINRNNFLEAITKSEGLKAFGALIPSGSELQGRRLLATNKFSNIHQQVQIALLAMKSGLCVAADLREGDFDTHVDHDRHHAIVLANAIDAIDYLWDYAEQLGVADRLVVVMGSDFARTPYYNAGLGKDHWPIGSYVIMEKNAAYTNWVAGETDELHNAYAINLKTLRRDDVNGKRLYSNHVHKALRRYLGLENYALAKLFPFNNTEDFSFFG